MDQPPSVLSESEIQSESYSTKEISLFSASKSFMDVPEFERPKLENPKDRPNKLKISSPSDSVKITYSSGSIIKSGIGFCVDPISKFQFSRCK